MSRAELAWMQQNGLINPSEDSHLATFVADAQPPDRSSAAVAQLLVDRGLLPIPGKASEHFLGLQLMAMPHAVLSYGLHQPGYPSQHINLYQVDNYAAMGIIDADNDQISIDVPRSLPTWVHYLFNLLGGHDVDEQQTKTVIQRRIADTLRVFWARLGAAPDAVITQDQVNDLVGRSMGDKAAIGSKLIVRMLVKSGYVQEEADGSLRIADDYRDALAAWISNTWIRIDYAPTALAARHVEARTFQLCGDRNPRFLYQEVRYHDLSEAGDAPHVDEVTGKEGLKKVLDDNPMLVLQPVGGEQLTNMLIETMLQ
ncbi:MAG: hypothetical protein AAF772_14425 [Acidobacteriota bacterium]